MSDGIKGEVELQELKNRDKTWTPPETLDEYLDFIRLVVETSKYKDAYKESTALELATVAKLKFRRIAVTPDVEELVDVAVYGYLAYDVLIRTMEKKSNETD